MTLTRRTKALVVVALALAIAAAAALVLGMTGDETQAGTQSQGFTMEEYASDTTSAAPLAGEAYAADPAKEQPVLDKFESKNPFRPLYVKAESAGDTSGGTASDSTASQVTGAKIKVNGDALSVKVGDQVPSGSPVFTIAAINSNEVVFKLMGENEFDDGSSSVSVGVGESVEVTNEDTGKTYTLAVTEILFSDGSSVDTTASTSGHTFAALSISSADGVAVVTVKVDGEIYSDLKTGEVVSTAAGDLKVVAINEGAQSATVLWGDADLVLHVGSTLTK